MESYDYILTICIVLISTKLLSLWTGKMQMPQVVGALLAGLLLGPAVLGVIAPSEFLSQLAELGVIVIMFSAGLETSVEDLKTTGKNGFLVALAGVIVPLVLGAALMFAFTPSVPVLEAVFIGVVLTATSVSITVETLKEIGKLSTKVGNMILAAALIDDILGLICLTIVTSLAGAQVNIFIVLLKIALFFVFVLVVGIAVQKFMLWYDNRVHDRNLHRFPLLGVALCLFMAWSAEAIFGVADIIGGFAAGMIIATTPKGKYIEGKVSPLSYLLLTPIFFANIGLKVDLSGLQLEMLWFTLALVVVGIGSKLIGCGLGAKLCGYNNRQCLQTGFGMACRGEVALIVASKGIAMHVVPEVYFAPIIILVVCCAVFTPILLKMAFKNESAYEGLAQSDLVDNYEIVSQMEMVTDRLLTSNSAKQKESTQE